MSTNETILSRLSEGQADALAFFLHTMQKDSILEKLHGNRTEADFDSVMLSKMKRTINNLMFDSNDAIDFYQMASFLIKQQNYSSDPFFNEICSIHALYRMGIEEGKRIERQKRSH